MLNIVCGFGMVLLGKVPYIQQLSIHMESLPIVLWGNLVLNLMLVGLLAISLPQLALFFFGMSRKLNPE